MPASRRRLSEAESKGTAVVSVNRPHRYRFGTVGPSVPDVEVQIAPDGESLVRGETVFRGYYGNEEATRAVLSDDGWLRTGDLGALDDDGFLTLVDRKKEIIVTSSSANIAPQNAENALTASKYLSQALVIGDGRPRVAALLTLNHREARKDRRHGRGVARARGASRRRGQPAAPRRGEALRRPRVRLPAREGRADAYAEGQAARGRRPFPRRDRRALRAASHRVAPGLLCEA